MKYWKWVATLTGPVRDLAATLDPWTLYRIDSRWRGTFRGFLRGPPLLVALEISPAYNRMMPCPGGSMEVHVRPDLLEPCDLPARHERGFIDVPVRIDGWITEH